MMRCYTPAAYNTSAHQQEGARAYTRDPGALGAGLGQPFNRLRIVDLTACTASTRNDHDVDIRCVGVGGIGNHSHPHFAHNGPGQLGDRYHALVDQAIDRRSQDLPGAHKIHLLRPIKQQYPDCVRHRPAFALM